MSRGYWKERRAVSAWARCRRRRAGKRPSTAARPVLKSTTGMAKLDGAEPVQGSAESARPSRAHHPIELLAQAYGVGL